VETGQFLEIKAEKCLGNWWKIVSWKWPGVVATPETLISQVSRIYTGMFQMKYNQNK
jgi:hypothetical protein